MSHEEINLERYKTREGAMQVVLVHYWEQVTNSVGDEWCALHVSPFHKMPKIWVPHN